MSRGPVQLHAWIRRQPEPHRIRLDGSTIVPIGTGRTRWTDALSVVDELDPGLIEALDAEGQVLRVTRRGPAEGPAPVESLTTSAGAAAGSYVEIARLLAEAGDRGALRHAEAYALAFGRMTELVQILAERLGGLERAWQATLEQRAADLAAVAPSEDSAGSAVQGMLAAVLAQQQPRGPIGAITGGKKGTGS